MSYNKSKLAEDNDVSISRLGFFRIPACLEALLKFAKHSLNVFEEFVRSNLIASPLMKPLFTPGGLQEVKCVYCKVSVGL